MHRGAFEPVLSDEDQKIDPDRWCSHSAWGQECWQLIAQWVWNLRLELGHQHHPDPARATEFAPALPPSPPYVAPASGYAPPEGGPAGKVGRFAGQDFAIQPDGTLRCPADQKLTPHEHRREADGSLRIVYGANIRSGRPCPKREQCRWLGSNISKPRQVSVLLHPLRVGSASLSGEIEAAENTDAPASSSCGTTRRFVTHCGRDPLPDAACALAPLVGRAPRSQCASSDG